VVFESASLFSKIIKSMPNKSQSTIAQRPAVSGAIPPTPLSEFARLPRPWERCAISGTSRTWLLETDAALPSAERFLFRVIPPGKHRGLVFIDSERLMNFLRRAQTENGKMSNKAAKPHSRQSQANP
jgi:hypothetical protein